jgi:putative transposase
MVDRGDPADRDRWARLRFAIIGPLLAAPPPRGDLQTTLHSLASRSWQHPITGQPTRFGLSTIERWYYAATRARLEAAGYIEVMREHRKVSVYTALEQKSGT